MRVLLVDRDEEILNAVLLGFRLEWPDCSVVTERDGQAGLRAFAAHSPDIVVLDLNLPNVDGFELVRAIRQVSDVPLILLSSRPTEDSLIRGLDLGADDYIVKPFSIFTLLARVRALLRRAAPQLSVSPRQSLVFPDLTIHADRQQVILRGEEVQLTPAEFRLLYELASSPNRVIPNRDLQESVWGASWQVTANDLKALVYRVRHKLHEDSAHPRFIENQRRLGYRFVAQPPLPHQAAPASAPIGQA